MGVGVKIPPPTQNIILMENEEQEEAKIHAQEMDQMAAEIEREPQEPED